MHTHTNKNLGFIRACAKNLGASEESISKLEKAEHRDPQDWDADQAARFWNRPVGHYLDDLGIMPNVDLQNGDRVLDLHDIDVSRPWTVAACGPKRVTLAREAFDDGSFCRGKEARRNLDTDYARRVLIPFFGEYESAVVGFVVGYQASSAIDYSELTGRLSHWVTFRARLVGLIKRLEKDRGCA